MHSPTEFRSAIDESGVELDQPGARIDLLLRIDPRPDSAHTDDRQRALQRSAEPPDHLRRLRTQRCARKAAGFVAVAQCRDRIARDGGISGDDRFDLQLHQQCGDGFDLFAREVRRDLHRQRHLPAVRVGEALLLVLERAQKSAQRVGVLQRAQVGGVRRRDVDRHVARVHVDLAQAMQVVVGCALVRRVEVLADVDAQHAAVAGEARARDVADQRIDTLVVEAEAVDQRLRLGQPEHSRLWIARLRARRCRADLDETETERGERIDVRAVLVHPRGEADRIRELDPHRLHRAAARAIRDQAAQAKRMCAIERLERQRVRALRIERE
jgi:hypothetical protein